MDPLVIDARFNGPAGSGNGGYTAGLVASALAVPAGHTAQVTLRRPPPLDTPLRVTRTGGPPSGIEVSAGGQVVAEAAAVPLAALGPDANRPGGGRPDGLPVPSAGYPEAVAAAAAYPGITDHPFPTCYVCGPYRPTGDGLRIFPGPLPDGGGVAAPWRVPEGAGVVTVWAALDCPGGWAITGPGRPYVLGRMAADVSGVPPPGARCVVVGTVTATEGRKAEVRTALYQAPDGTAGGAPGGPRLLAHARSTWVALAS